MPGIEQVAVGLRHRETLRVEAWHTVPALCEDWPGFKDMPPVLATAMLVGFLEQTCIQALRPYLAPGQRTVGTKIELTHSSPTPVGMTVAAEVELIAREGRAFFFRVAARDAAGGIGAGVHERKLVGQEDFMRRAERKRQDVRGI